MSEPCMCGDTECPTCGSYQGTYTSPDPGLPPRKCEVCGADHIEYGPCDVCMDAYKAMDQVRGAGYRAFYEGPFENPYSEAQPERQYWQEGYDSASIENDIGEPTSWL